MLTYLLPILVIAILFFLYKNQQSAKKQAAINLEAGHNFLKENAKNENVQQTSSGLQYQVLKEGHGELHPTPTSQVKVHYHGTLIDGSVFDSSVDRGEPISFGLNQVIKGWTEGLQLMVVGEKTRLFIPSELAYGNGSAGIITPGSTLIFDVELLEFS
jgi:peptidylprolyl isomerase